MSTSKRVPHHYVIKELFVIISRPRWKYQKLAKDLFTFIFDFKCHDFAFRITSSLCGEFPPVTEACKVQNVSMSWYNHGRLGLLFVSRYHPANWSISTSHTFDIGFEISLLNCYRSAKSLRSLRITLCVIRYIFQPCCNGNLCLSEDLLNEIFHRDGVSVKRLHNSYFFIAVLWDFTRCHWQFWVTSVIHRKIFRNEIHKNLEETCVTFCHD